MISSRNFTVLHSTLKSMKHLELIFVKRIIQSMFSFIFYLYWCHIVPVTFMKNLHFLHQITFLSLSNNTSLYFLKYIFRLSILLYCCKCLTISHHHHTVLVTSLLKKSWNWVVIFFQFCSLLLYWIFIFLFIYLWKSVSQYRQKSLLKIHLAPH